MSHSEKDVEHEWQPQNEPKKNKKNKNPWTSTSFFTHTLLLKI